jgi:hypothetical protein
MKGRLTFDDVVNNIREALTGMDGDEVADANNYISSEIEYVEDNVWRYKVREE